MEKIYFYYFPLCPRSYLSLKNLEREIKTSDLEVKCIKKIIFKFKGKIFFPPALLYKNQILTGFYLSKPEIRKFLKNFYEF